MHWFLHSLLVFVVGLDISVSTTSVNVCVISALCLSSCLFNPSTVSKTHTNTFTHIHNFGTNTLHLGPQINVSVCKVLVVIEFFVAFYYFLFGTSS